MIFESPCYVSNPGYNEDFYFIFNFQHWLTWVTLTVSAQKQSGIDSLI